MSEEREEGEEREPMIAVNVPLFIRLLEFAREDARDDLALHNLTENAIRMMGEEKGECLDMDDYAELVKGTQSSKKSKTTYPKIARSYVR